MGSTSQDDYEVKVKGAISKLIRDFRGYPDIFLTEEDTRCRLYTYLLEDFNQIEKSRHNVLSIPLHTEVRWYGNKEKLKLRSDIVIIDALSLDTNKKYVLSKGYSFADAIAVIELKLRRVKYSPNNSEFRKIIEDDMEKLRKIRDNVNIMSGLYLLVFDKRDNMGISNTNNGGIHQFYVFGGRYDSNNSVIKI